MTLNVRDIEDHQMLKYRHLGSFTYNSHTNPKRNGVLCRYDGSMTPMTDDLALNDPQCESHCGLH